MEAHSEIVALTQATVWPYLWLMPALPLFGAFINAVAGKKIEAAFGKKVNHFIAIGAMVAATTVAIFTMVQLISMPAGARLILDPGWRWIDIGPIVINFSFQFDALSGVMAVMVSFVATLIHIYSIGYMRDEEGNWRFFCYLNLFVFAMLTLVLGDNFIVMFVGWEGVGLASYLLIGFWYDRGAEALYPARSGMKAFIVNRFGDAGFLVGLFILLWAMTGDLNGVSGFDASKMSVVFREIQAGVGAGIFEGKTIWGVSVLTIACILFFWGAAAKSSQIPLYIWLPDAMAGPTPVSALIHAATMVTAGVYMVARLNFLFIQSPLAMTVVAVVGGATALYAATIGLFQYDIKKVLAYSTISQLGYMFVGVGIGVYWVGIFHLLTHAFFKACLFLGSGSVILGSHHEQDMRRMGGLKKFMPITHVTYLISCIAIAGFPIAAGFYSKDEILWKAFDSGNLLVPGWTVWLAGFVGASLTSFYMFRSYFMTFTGKNRLGAPLPKNEKLYEAAELQVAGKALPAHIVAPDPHGQDDAHGQGDAHGHDDEHGHDGHDGHHGDPEEQPRSMTWVLAVLAFGAVALSFIGLPHLWTHSKSLIEQFLEPVMAVSVPLVKSEGYSHGLEWGLMAASIGVATAGMFLAWALYKGGTSQLPLRLLANKQLRYVHQLVFNKYYIDELYDHLVVRTSMELMVVLRGFDEKVLDALVNGVGAFGRFISWLHGLTDTYVVDGLVNLVGNSTIGSGSKLRNIQTGRIQDYIYVLVGGSIVIAIIVFGISLR